ncbi:MAG: hypothetical protein ACR2O3_12760 [Rhizobiaceae bacterium]
MTDANKYLLAASIGVNIIFAIMLILSYQSIRELNRIETELSKMTGLEKKIGQRLSGFNEGVQLRLEQSDQKIALILQELEKIQNSIDELDATTSRQILTESQDDYPSETEVKPENGVPIQGNGSSVNSGQYRRSIQSDGKVVYELVR